MFMSPLKTTAGFLQQTQRHMFLLASGRHIRAPQRNTNMGSPYMALSIWVKHFFEYLPHETMHRPESLRDCLNIHLLLPFWFLILFVEWLWWWWDSEYRKYAFYSYHPETIIKYFVTNLNWTQTQHHGRASRSMMSAFKNKEKEQRN